VGRFELYSGQNFNRHYPDIKTAVGDRVAAQLGADPARNAQLVRGAIRAELAAQSPATELAALRTTLLTLAMDAQVVLDLHCDLEALLHIYTTPTGEALGRSLSAYLGAPVLLLAQDSGGNCFDETCSCLWDALRQRFAAHPVPAGCFSATVELRGQADVSDALAAGDAQRLLAWLGQQGFVLGLDEAPLYAPAAPTPLAGSEDVKAPVGGIVSFRAQVGDHLQPGAPIADIIDPSTGARTTVCTRNDGVVYTREHRRFIRRGSTLALITGKVATRTGSLLSA